VLYFRLFKSVKYLSLETIKVDKYRNNCYSLENKSIVCSKVLDGTEDKIVEVWRDYNNEAKIGEIKKISLWTEVKDGDYIDWIPTIAGVEISEFAFWRESLSAGLVRYYQLNETTGTVGLEALYGIHNLTINTSVILGQNGILSYAHNYTGETASYDFANFSGLPSADQNRTLNFWLYRETTCVDYDEILGYGDNSPGSGSNFYFRCHNENYLSFEGISADWDSIYELPLNKWVMITGIYNGTGLSLYVNGTLYAGKALTLNTNLDDEMLMIGARRSDGGVIDGQVNMKVDELGIWNRTLSSSEVSDLWNSGAGLPVFSNNPEVTLYYPLNTTYISTIINFNCTALDDSIIENITLYINGTANYTLINGVSNFSELYQTYTLPPGSYNWTCKAYDDKSLSTTPATILFNVEGLKINSVTYNISTQEDSNENFAVNITYNSTIYPLATASLLYNGTTYSSTSTTSGGDIIFSRSILVPIYPTDGNTTFKWIVYLTNSSGTYNINSSEYNQFVGVINASIINQPYGMNYLNFTLYNEETLERINGSFDFTMNYGTRSFIKNLSFSNITENQSSYSFGFHPNYSTFLVKGIAEYGREGYETRIYTFPQQYLTNITTNISLYLLNSSISTSYIVYVRDNDYSPIEGAIVHIQRYYSSTNIWQTVEVIETNTQGKSLGHFIAEDVNYRFLIYINGILELTTTSTKIFCEATPCTITLTLPGTSAYNPYENLSQFTFDLTYSVSTEAFTYSYIDSSSTASGGRLYVIKSSFGNATEQIICNTSSAAATAVLSCDITAFSNGTYYAFAYNIRGAKSNLVKNLIILKTANPVSNIGTDGLVWAIFFILAIVMVGLFKPAVAIVFSIAGVLFISLLGLASIPYISLFSIIAMGVILLWQMRS
jgi:hypothetical protein